MKEYLTTYNHVKDFLPYLSRFWIRPLFTPNFWSSFWVQNLKLRDSLLWNLVHTNNLWISNCCKKIFVRGAALMLWRNADFSCHAARRGAPTTARGRVSCTVAISTFYCRPEVCVRVNGKQSKPFHVGIRLRQGCVLSPLLLIVYEELVVQNLRSEPHSSVTVRRFRKLKSCCYVIAIPSGWHPCPNPNCNQGRVVRGGRWGRASPVELCKGKWK